MWVFYYNATQPSTGDSGELASFLLVGLVTALVVMLPSYLEKKRNESR